jgi:murein DD-endopeptidase MepM/ murein hydrolase activator NlpD
MTRRLVPVCVLIFASSVLLSSGSPATAHGTWQWPVVGPVIRGYDPPSSPYGSGHRGIDIAAPYGSSVVAAASGTVSFAGPVGGKLYVTIDHGGSLASTYSFLSKVLVKKGTKVAAGQLIALSGFGHPGETPSHLHFGVKLGDSYMDPMLYLSPIDLTGFIRLAPLY